MHFSQFLMSPLISIKAYCKYIKLKNKCAYFGGFINDDIYYALGFEVSCYENVIIGKRCSFGGNIMLNAHDKIVIGDDCLIAYGVVINTAGHDYTAEIMNQSFYSKPVQIGSNVWLGANALILPGVTIEDGAVVGAGAVVTKDVPRNAIVVGNPAKIVKYRPDISAKSQELI